MSLPSIEARSVSRVLPAAETPPATGASSVQAPFDLDVTLIEVADPAGLVNVTDDGCTSTCGACTTGVA